MRRERFWKKACAILVCCLVSAACFRAPREREILVSTAISLKDAFEELGELYERWIEDYSLSPVVVVPGDDLDFVNSEADLKRVLDLLERHGLTAPVVG